MQVWLCHPRRSVGICPIQKPQKTTIEDSKEGQTITQNYLQLSKNSPFLKWVYYGQILIPKKITKIQG
jgi:hypothetical protein